MFVLPFLACSALLRASWVALGGHSGLLWGSLWKASWTIPGIIRLLLGVIFVGFQQVNWTSARCGLVLAVRAGILVQITVQGLHVVRTSTLLFRPIPELLVSWCLFPSFLVPLG